MNPIEVQVSGAQGIIPATYKTVVLKPNIVNGKNILTQLMMNSTDTKYVIKHDYIISDSTTSDAVQVLDTNISHCVNPAYTTALAAYNEAHDAWIDADNAYTNNPNETTLAAKNAAYAAYTAAQTALNNTPQYYYYAAKAINLKKDQHIAIQEGCVLLNSSVSGLAGINVAQSDTTVYIGSDTPGNYSYTVQYAIQVPARCLIEFDGGSISNGTMVGNNTILIYNQELEDVMKNVTKEGTFVYNNILSADEEDLTEKGNILQFKDRPNTDGMGRVILRKNKSFASQLTQTNTIYEIRYDFDLNSAEVAIPANCVLEFEGGSLSNGTLNLNNTLFTNNIRFINTVVRGTTANQCFYSNWFNNINNFAQSCSNTNGFTKIDVKEGTYDLSESFVLHGNIDADFHNSLIRINDNINFLSINSNETSVLLTSLVTEASIGDKQIFVNSVEGINRGDILILKDETANSFNTYNVIDPARNYKQGEMIIVYSVDPSENKIELVNPLYGNYLSSNLSNCKLFRINFYSYCIQNVRVEFNKQNTYSEKTAIDLINGINSVVRNVIINGYDLNIHIHQSYNTRVEDCELTTSLIERSSENVMYIQYGVHISSSQNITVKNISGSCGNHLCSLVGGTFPSRNILFKNIVSKSVHQGFCGINMHGCSEYVTIDGCILAGVDIGGDYVIIKNSHIYECFYNNGEDNYSISLNEITGYNITVDNCLIRGRMYDRYNYYGGLVSKDSILTIKNSTIEKSFDSHLVQRKVDIGDHVDGNYLGSICIVFDNCVIQNSTLQTLIFDSDVNSVTFKNCIFKRTGLSIYRIQNCYFTDNNIEARNIIAIDVSNYARMDTMIFKNNIMIHKGTTSGTLVNFLSGGTVNYLAFTSNYFKTDNFSITKFGDKNIVKNLLFKGNAIDNGNNSYTEIKCKNLWIDDTPELAIDNHLAIEANKISEGTAKVKLSGSSTGRPNGSKIYRGFIYFDTTLGKPIYASAISGDTVTWVDATGTPV